MASTWAGVDEACARAIDAPATHKKTTNRTALQKFRMKWPREKILQAQRLALAVKIDQNDFDVSADFPQHLTASAAGWGQRRSIGRHGDAPEFSRAFGDSLEGGGSLGA